MLKFHTEALIDLYSIDFIDLKGRQSIIQAHTCIDLYVSSHLHLLHLHLQKFEADGWICRLCGSPLAEELQLFRGHFWISPPQFHIIISCDEKISPLV